MLVLRVAFLRRSNCVLESCRKLPSTEVLTATLSTPMRLATVFCNCAVRTLSCFYPSSLDTMTKSNSDFVSGPMSLGRVVSVLQLYGALRIRSPHSRSFFPSISKSICYYCSLSHCEYNLVRKGLNDSALDDVIRDFLNVDCAARSEVDHEDCFEGFCPEPGTSSSLSRSSPISIIPFLA